MKKSVIPGEEKNEMEKPSNSYIKKQVKELEKSLGINTNAKNIPAYFIFGGWLCVISSIKLIIIVGLILASIAFVLSFSKIYKNAYRWNKSITFYFNNDIEKAKISLDKLSSNEKEGKAYNKMLKLLNEAK
ncbi:hypothetical protein psyc5s11_38800 [Clostridium gelidum]|uniref:Uncharacterized protein n=1 Tax=Clostridium gelidum TaxID=704125 RepID=A0ABM7T731_9CLOT|nr:hypothetical protein [Clostridium gelidum]BCZ47813.1 hypothetical protein psyc5s11_38800 [Clostridium gelidum]